MQKHLNLSVFGWRNVSFRHSLERIMHKLTEDRSLPEVERGLSPAKCFHGWLKCTPVLWLSPLRGAWMPQWALSLCIWAMDSTPTKWQIGWSASPSNILTLILSLDHSKDPLGKQECRYLNVGKNNQLHQTQDGSPGICIQLVAYFEHFKSF